MYQNSFKPTENNKHFNVIGRSTYSIDKYGNPSIEGGYSSTAKAFPYPRGYQKRTPGKILKVKIWKLSKDFDDMIWREVNSLLKAQKSVPISVSSRQAK